MKVKKLAITAAIFLHSFILNTNAADKEYKCFLGEKIKMGPKEITV